MGGKRESTVDFWDSPPESLVFKIINVLLRTKQLLIIREAIKVIVVHSAKDINLDTHVWMRFDRKLTW